MSDYTQTRDQITDAAKQQAFAFALHAVTQLFIYGWNTYAAPKLNAHGFPVVPLPTIPADPAKATG